MTKQELVQELVELRAASREIGRPARRWSLDTYDQNSWDRSGLGVRPDGEVSMYERCMDMLDVPRHQKLS
jgi:hypothetical protein